MYLVNESILYIVYVLKYVTIFYIGISVNMTFNSQSLFTIKYVLKMCKTSPRLQGR